MGEGEGDVEGSRSENNGGGNEEEDDDRLAKRKPARRTFPRPKLLRKPIHFPYIYIYIYCTLHTPLQHVCVR